MRGRFSFLRSLRCQDGVAALEFALAAPMLLLVLTTGMEVSRLLLVHQKAERVAYTSSDIVSQETSLTIAQLGALMGAATQIMQPFTFGADGTVIITCVYKDSTNALTPPVVRWQYTGGGTLSRASRIGTVNGNAALPGGLTLNYRDNIIIAEVYYRYRPVVSGAVIHEQDIYKTSIFKPRLGALTTPPA